MVTGTLTGGLAAAQDTLARIARNRTKRILAASVLFLVLTLLWNLPIALHPTTEVLSGPADGTLSIRGNWMTAEQGQTVFTATRDTLNGAPEGLPFLNSTEWAQPVQVAFLLVLHYAVGWIGAWNVFVMLGFLLTGIFGFLLLDRMGFHPLICIFGGYVLAFNPWMFERAEAGHAAFLHVWVFAALYLALLRMSRLRTASSALLAGLCFGTAFLFASYFGLLASVLVVAYFVYEIVHVDGVVERLWTISLGCVVGAVTLLLLAPGLVKYALDHHLVATSISNSVVEAQRLGADTSEYLLPDWRHPVFGPITRSYAPSRNFSEGTLFFGYTTIALAIVGVVLLIRKAPETVRSTTRHRGLIFAAILVPVAYWSSLKSVVHPFGIPVAALSWFLTHVTSFFRVYARFGVLVGLGLIVLAAPALERIMRRARHGTLIVAALLAVVAFELVPGPIVGWAATNPPVYDRWLKTQPLGIVAHYPALTDQEPAIHLGEREIYYQMFAKKPLYNIFGPGTGNTRESAIRILSRYITDPLTPSILAAEHVRYVVLHDDVYRSQHETPPQAPPQLKLVKRFPDVRVYTLRPGVAAADLDPLLEQNAAAIGLVEGLAFDSVDLGGGFSGTFTYDKEDGWRRLHGAGTITLQNTNVNLKRVQIVVRAVSPGVPRTVELLGSDGTVIARNTIATQATQVTFGPFPVALGTTRLSLRTQQRTPKGADLLVAPLLIQPLADFSNSLRAS